VVSFQRLALSSVEGSAAKGWRVVLILPQEKVVLAGKEKTGRKKSAYMAGLPGDRQFSIPFLFPT